MILGFGAVIRGSVAKIEFFRPGKDWGLFGQDWESWVPNRGFLGHDWGSRAMIGDSGFKIGGSGFKIGGSGFKIGSSEAQGDILMELLK